MLFIIVMDMLNNLLREAEHCDLTPVGRPHGIPNRLSLYADDTALFVSPAITDLQAIKEILKVFEEASGLLTNLIKS